MPTKRITLCLLGILYVSVAQAATYEIAGQVTGGTSLFPHVGSKVGLGFNEVGLPVGGYPVDFVGRLSVEDGQQEWSFAFELTDEIQTVRGGVQGTVIEGSDTRFSRNDVTLSSQQVLINYHRFDSWGVNFFLDANLELETGVWSFYDFCPVCDLAYALPSAVGEITSVRPVPEPVSLFSAIAVLIVWGAGRHRVV